MACLAHVAIDLAARIEALLLVWRQWREPARRAPGLPGHSTRASTAAARAPSSLPAAAVRDKRRRLTIQAQDPRAAAPGGACADVDRRSLRETHTRRPGRRGRPDTLGTAAFGVGGAPRRADSGARHRARRAAPLQPRAAPPRAATPDARPSAIGREHALDGRVLRAAHDRRGDHRHRRFALRRLRRHRPRAARRARPLRVPRTPLSAASTATGSSPRALEQRRNSAARAASPAARRATPRAAARTLQSVSSSRFNTAACTGLVRVAEPSLGDPQGGDAHVARRPRAPWSTVAGSMRIEAVERPQRVQPSRASPARSSPASRASGTTVWSPRSTSSRCAVSRHQPFGCDSAVDELRGRRASPAPASCPASSSRGRRDRCGPARSAAPACA